MNRAADQFKNFLEDFLTKNALESLNKTKKRTPVDTGELRRNWEISSVVRKGADLVVYLYNSKEYASYVEDGHATRNREGWVEGYYMATISIEEIERKMPQRFNREFLKFMDSLEVG
ncbi:TPA: HK97 gp10 family phage protein [Clostridium perfringens]|uniref:HK97 gp10 family phage protein n=1 Tax=Clostridium perfringens TaxID=1502 RepID=A0A8H9R0X8_CLOPF|nr:HK97 gp10 family phage protein [Clostridium perfringens]